MEVKKINKKVIVLFSSGVDSTYLVWKNLIEGNQVIPYFIELKNNKNQTEYEQQQINILYNIFHEEFSDLIEKPKVISSVDIFNATNYQLPQPILWTTFISGAIRRDIDEVHIGYVINDCAISYLDDIKNLYKATKPFVDYLPKLKFPLIKTSKYNIVNELPEKYLIHTTSCENPRKKDYKIKIKKKGGTEYNFYEPCGYCTSCKKNITEEFFGSKIIRNKYYKHDNKVKETYVKKSWEEMH